MNAHRSTTAAVCLVVGLLHCAACASNKPQEKAPEPPPKQKVVVADPEEAAAAPALGTVVVLTSQQFAGAAESTVGTGEESLTGQAALAHLRLHGAVLAPACDVSAMPGLAALKAGGRVTPEDIKDVAARCQANVVVTIRASGNDRGPAMVAGLHAIAMTVGFRAYAGPDARLLGAAERLNTMPCVSGDLAPAACSESYSRRLVADGLREMVLKAAGNVAR